VLDTIVPLEKNRNPLSLFTIPFTYASRNYDAQYNSAAVGGEEGEKREREREREKEGRRSDESGIALKRQPGSTDIERQTFKCKLFVFKHSGANCLI
jgi:hypothetical protein